MKSQSFRSNILKYLTNEVNQYFSGFEETKNYLRIKSIQDPIKVYNLLNQTSDERIALDLDIDVAPVKKFR